MRNECEVCKAVHRVQQRAGTGIRASGEDLAKGVDGMQTAPIDAETESEL